MKPLTLQEAKDQVAKKETVIYNTFDLAGRELSFPTINKLFDEAAQLFGDSQWNAALDMAIKEAEMEMDASGDDLEYKVAQRIIEELKKLKR